MSDARSFARPVAERIARRVGLLAGRLAELLESAMAAEPALESGKGFLAAMATSTRESLARAEPAEGSHPLDALVAGLGLSPLEVDLLVLAGMPDEHEGYGSVLRAVHPRQEPRPTVGLAAQLFCRTAQQRQLLREMLEVGPAVRSGALTLTGDAPFFERSLGCAEAMWPVLNGLDVWPAGLEPLREPLHDGGLGTWLETPEIARAAAALRSGQSRLVLFTAEVATMALHRAAAVVVQAGLHPLCFAWPPANATDGERLLVLHVLARGAIPVLRLSSRDASAPTEVPILRWLPGPVVACLHSAAVVSSERTVLSVAVAPLSPTERRAVWTEALGEMAHEASTLAARYTLEPHAVATVARDVRSIAELQAGTIGLGDVAASVRTRSNLALASGVKLMRSSVGWKDLVLSADHLKQLREAVARLEHQPRVLDDWKFLQGRTGSRGVRMLFAGPSGTGKTLAAQVMAGALGVDLLVVDLARVVSKWIGETEKNLAEVFDAAERSQVVLLFDEADALFGKRTEISDAHDRYANLETAYLLSRLERFEGLAILSTNLRPNIDPAFVRRLEFVIDFHEPSRQERELLWNGHLPPKALADDVDIPRLAALYPIVGGSIRNAAVAAGFLAAAEGPRALIGNHHLTLAVRREYAKAGRAFPASPAATQH